MDAQERKEFPILKELSKPHQTTRFLGVDLQMRQFFIVAAAVFPLLAAYRLGLFALLGLSPLQVAGVAVPLVGVALLFAFGGWGGKDFSFIAQKRLLSATRARRLVWRRRTARSPEWLRDAVQRYLPAERFQWDMLKLRGGPYVRILEVEADSLSLASEAHRERVRARLAQAYASFDFEVVEYTRSRPSSMGTYLSRLRDELEAEVAILLRENRHDEAAARLSAGEQHIEHVRGMVADRSAYERTSYLILTYTPQTARATSVAGQIREMLSPIVSLVSRKPSRGSTRKGQQEANTTYRKLSERQGVVTEAYGRVGLNLLPLDEHEALAFYREEAGATNLAGVRDLSGSPAEDQAPTPLGPAVTLTDEQYARMGEKALQKRVEAAEEVRAGEEGAPPVVGLGELTVNDRIAPEAVTVERDHIRVGSTCQRTLYVYDLPEKVGFGILQSLVEMKERIKVVKYIRPFSKKEALDILGKKESDLRVAERLTAAGNLLTRQAKETARKNAEFARTEVAADRERYYEFSLLVHLEAASLEELDALTDRVRTKLDETYAYTHAALDEMWEGYVSCLPFGQLSLEEKYCSSGILTNPLSCFSTFSTLQLNHARGVLWGTDQNTGSPVAVDDTHLANSHKLVWGSSGKGKTVLVKALATRSLYRGETNILIDPEGRTGYERVARWVGGQFVKLGHGSRSRINPFDLRFNDYLDLDSLGDQIDEDEDPEEALRRAREGAFNSKVTALVALVSLMATSTGQAGGALSTRVQGKLERVIAECYAEKGIGEDPDTHQSTPPIMPEFFEKLAEYAAEDADLADLRESLYPWEHGSQRKIFDGHTNVDLRSRFLCVRISAGEEGPEKAPLMFVLLDFLRGRLADPRESITCYIDELWALLGYPMAASLLNGLWRASRASNTAMVGITQELEEFLQSRRAETLIRLSETKVLLGQDKATVEEVARYVELSEKTKEDISTRYARGEALLVAGQRQVPIKVVLSEEEMRLFNTDPTIAEHHRREDEAARAETELAATLEQEAPVAEPSTDELLTQDLSTVPVTENGHAEDGHAAELSLDRIAPRANGKPAGRIYALGGHAAPEVAFALAGLFAAAAKRAETGGRVLLVDACGTISKGPLDGFRRPPTDDLIYTAQGENGGGGPHRPTGDYLVPEQDSGLNVLKYPDQASMGAFELAQRLAGEFDAIVVACGQRPGGQGGGKHWPRYAAEWVLSASRIAAASSDPARLTAGVRSIEELGEFNHPPVLVLAGGNTPPQEVSGENLPSRDFFSLPEAAALRRAMEEGQFASLDDPEATGGFVRLAGKLTR